MTEGVDGPGPESRADSPLDVEMVYQLYHSVNDAIFVHDAETGEIVDVNETMCEMYGYTREEARQLTVEDLSSGEPPYTQEYAAQYLKKAAGGEPQLFDWRAKDSDGNLFWVEVSMRRAMVDGEMYILVLVRDISERIEYKRQLEEQNEKLQLLNRIVRHDIRNDMDVILNFAPHVAEALDDEQAEDYLQRMVESGQHVAELTQIVRDLMEAMLGEEDATYPRSLSDVLQTELDTIRAMEETVVVDGLENPPTVAVEANEMLETVFRNLLTNAVRHNNADTPEIAVSVTEAGDDAVVRIADNGPGIPDDRKDEIFGRGEKGLESPGTGVGLYLVDQLVDNYGGEIWVEDNDPRGSVFVVRLPKSSQDQSEEYGQSDWLSQV